MSRLCGAHATGRPVKVCCEPISRSRTRSRCASTARTWVPLEDLQQIAPLGLIKALDRFDPGNGAAFSSFAVPTIEGEIRRHLRDFTWTVPPRRGLQERVTIPRRTRARPALHATSAQLHRRRPRLIGPRPHDRGHPRRRRSCPGPRRATPSTAHSPPPTAATLPHARQPLEPKTRRASPPPSHRHARRPARHAVRTRRARSAPTRPRGPHPSRKSANASATPKCRCRASCAPPSPNSPSTRKPTPLRPTHPHENSSLILRSSRRRPLTSHSVARTIALHGPSPPATVEHSLHNHQGRLASLAAGARLRAAASGRPCRRPSPPDDRQHVGASSRSPARARSLPGPLASASAPQGDPLRGSLRSALSGSASDTAGHLR